MRRLAPVLCAAIALQVHAQSQVIDLSGAHKINVEADSLDFTHPEFNDSTWPMIVVPGSLRAQGFDARPDVFWYRIRFELPKDWNSSAPAIRLGVIDRSDDVYLNGTRIGGLGQIGHRMSDWHAYAPIQPRLYTVPPGLLNAGGPNVLAMRIAREPYIDDGGILSGPTILADMDVVLPDHLRDTWRFAVVNYTLFGIELLTLAVVLLMVLFRDQRRLSLLFSLLFSCYVFGTLERRGVLDAFGFESPGLQFAANVVPALCIPLMMSFVAGVLKRPLSWFARVLQFGLVASLVVIPGTDIAQLNWWAIESTLVWHALMVLALFLMVVWSIQAQMQRREHAVALLTGLGLLGIALVADMLLPADTVEATLGIRLGELGVLAFLLSLFSIFGAYVLKLEASLLRATSAVISAQEEERTRLAHDVHDSVGQRLTALKIKLDLLRSSKANPPESLSTSLDEVSADVEGALEETRRVAQDLSPLFLDSQGLIEGMHSLTELMAARGGAQITLQTPSELLLDRSTAKQVFWVFQEALRNAVAHSGADQIDVQLTGKGPNWQLSVQDNGCGIAADQSETRHNNTGGTGMSSMRNRALVLRGTLNVTSHPDKGTRVILSFPGRVGGVQ